jgi:hypothetical protein
MREGTGRRRRKHKQLLDDLKYNKGVWKLKEEGLDRTVWRTCFGTGCGPVLRWTKEFCFYLFIYLFVCNV